MDSHIEPPLWIFWAKRCRDNLANFELTFYLERLEWKRKTIQLYKIRLLSDARELFEKEAIECAKRAMKAYHRRFESIQGLEAPKGF